MMPPADVCATWRRKKVILVPLTPGGAIFLEADSLVVGRDDFAFLQRRAFELEVTIDVRPDDDVVTLAEQLHAAEVAEQQELEHLDHGSDGS